MDDPTTEQTIERLDRLCDALLSNQEMWFEDFYKHPISENKPRNKRIIVMKAEVPQEYIDEAKAAAENRKPEMKCKKCQCVIPERNIWRRGDVWLGYCRRKPARHVYKKAGKPCNTKNVRRAQ